jgi:hypothetical protein
MSKDRPADLVKLPPYPLRGASLHNPVSDDGVLAFSVIDYRRLQLVVHLDRRLLAIKDDGRRRLGLRGRCNKLFKRANVETRSLALC